MIRSEREYREAVRRLEQEAERLRAHAEALAAEGLSAQQIQRVLDPMRSFHEQLREEVEAYEHLQRGEFPDILNFSGLGQLLISLRIYRGLTQRELAARLGVHETQVSRDERNEYHGVTLERAQRVLDALDAELRTHVERPEPGTEHRRTA